MLPKNYIPKAGDCIRDEHGISIFAQSDSNHLSMIRLSDAYGGHKDTICIAGPRVEIGKKQLYGKDEWVFLGHIDFVKVEEVILQELGYDT